MDDCMEKLCRLESRIDELSGRVNKICNVQKTSESSRNISSSSFPKETRWERRRRLLDAVIGYLDIGKIQNVMAFLDWRWRIGSENKVPTEVDIVEWLEDLAKEAWKGLDLTCGDRNDHFSKTWTVSSGGFQVEVSSWWDDDGSIQECLRISFILDEAFEESRYV